MALIDLYELYLYSKITNFIVIFRKFCTRMLNTSSEKMFFLIIMDQLSKQVLDSLTLQNILYS